MAPNSGGCSRMRPWRPARPKASAVVNPPRPPPTMMIGGSAPPIQTSSCPRLSRASMSFFRRIRKQGVDGRDIRAFTPVFDGLLHGHDDVERSLPHASILPLHADPLDLPFERDT